MRPELSLYLDLVRFTAALVVFLSHFALQRISGGALWQMSDYGHQAVTVFFVLSGYVIAYACDTRESTARQYTINRLARLYSVALPAVLLTVLLDALGSRWFPEAYQPGWGFAPSWDPVAIAAALTFTNELWGLSIRLGSNPAYWSLGYEVPYYIVFGLIHFVRGWWRWALAALALLAAGPSIAITFPLWLMGVAAFRWSSRHSLSPLAGRCLFFGSLLLWIAYEYAVSQFGRPHIAVNGWFKRAQLPQDYIVGALFVLHLTAFPSVASDAGAALMRFAAPIRWLAGATFTLYLCHLPVAQALAAASPWPRADLRSRVLVFFGTLLAVFCLAAWTERRKAFWRQAFINGWPAARPVL